MQSCIYVRIFYPRFDEYLDFSDNVEASFNYLRPVYPEYRKLPVDNCFMSSNRIGKTRNHQKHTMKFI
jgi:hypothetical protein